MTDTLRKTPSSPDRSSHVVAGVADPDLKGAIFYKDPDPHARPKDPDPQNGLEPDFFFNILNGLDPAEWLERPIVNAEVITVLGSIPASSDTVESEGRQIKQR